MKLLFLGLGGQEILVIATLVLLLFGGKKIPELMSGIGKGVKSFRDGMNGTKTDDTDPKTGESNAAAPKAGEANGDAK